MNLTRLGTVLPATVGLAQPQTEASSRAQFEVATIKPSGVCEGGGTPQPGRLKLRCVTVPGLIQMAQMAHGYFANGVSYTPNILSDIGRSQLAQFRSLRHRGDGGRRSESGADAWPYASGASRRPVSLEIPSRHKGRCSLCDDRGKGRRQNAANGSGQLYPLDLKHPPPPPAPGSPPANLCGTENRKKNGQVLTVNVHGISTADIANGLFVELSGRTVIDKTGLGGLSDLHLEFTPGQTPPPDNPDAPSADDGTGPSILAAVQQQLGLKLEPAKGAVKVFIVDHVERPSGN